MVNYSHSVLCFHLLNEWPRNKTSDEAQMTWYTYRKANKTSATDQEEFFFAQVKFSRSKNTKSFYLNQVRFTGSTCPIPFSSIIFQISYPVEHTINKTWAVIGVGLLANPPRHVLLLTAICRWTAEFSVARLVFLSSTISGAKWNATWKSEMF